MFNIQRLSVLLRDYQKLSLGVFDVCQILHIWTPYFANVNLLVVLLPDVLV
jgi:hypothetical protein